MKKTIMALVCFLLMCASAYAAEPADLVFKPDTNGKYIYCNNHEFIRRSDLADYSNEKSKFIMNNENLTADKYALFVSHVNHTEKRADNGYTITEPGFDIELDVLFRARENTKIRIDSLGFEVPKNGQYWFRGTSYTYEDAWGCFNAWASYLNLPIKQIDSGQVYEPSAFEPLEFEIEAGEEVWLSKFIDNYCADPWFRPVHIMTDFEILSGVCDVNVAALKSNGTLGDRSNFNPNSDFGSFDRDRQYKGVADSLNHVSASLSYTIDDNLWSGTALPVKVYNQCVPEGNETTSWFTHLNPRADKWSKKVCTESDMLSFSYYDPIKKLYYGSKVSETDDFWHFDTQHNDCSVYSKAYGNQDSYVPNRALTDKDDETYACNLGNYGVVLSYNIHIRNDGDLIRYAKYDLSTGSNNVVVLRDADGNPMDGYALCKGARDARVTDTMACVELPAHSDTDFIVDVILTTNYSGGMQNSIVISDTPDIVEVYESEKQEIIHEYNYTGREFYKWENAKLYISDDLTEWKNVTLDKNIMDAVYGNWNEFSLLYTGSGYMLKPTLYDGIPYYTVQDFFRTVYFLDDNFKYKSKHTFNYYPSDFAAAKDVYFVKAATPYSSTDGKHWDYFPSAMPCYNYGRLAASSKNGVVMLSEDGVNFSKAVYHGFAPSYINSIGDIYYFAKGSKLYLSHEGVYWTKFDMPDNSKIKSIYKIGKNLVINNTHSIEIPEDQNGTIIKIGGKYMGLEAIPKIENGVTLVPAESIPKLFDTQIKLDGYGDYVPLRAIAESLGMSVEYNSELNIVNIN